MTTSSAGMNRMPIIKVDDPTNNNNNNNGCPPSPIVGDTKGKKTSRLSKIRASYSFQKSPEHDGGGDEDATNTTTTTTSTKKPNTPLKHLRKKLHKSRRRLSIGNKDEGPSSPSTSTNNTTNSHPNAAATSSNTDGPNNNNNNNKATKKNINSRFGRVKRSSSAVGSKLRQSLKGSVIKGSAALLKKEPSLVPDVDKKINKSIASKITASLKHRRAGNHNNNNHNNNKSNTTTNQQEEEKERSVSLEPKNSEQPKVDTATSTVGFSSDAYQPASTHNPTNNNKKKKKKKSKLTPEEREQKRKERQRREREEMTMELFLNPSVSYHATSPFHNNSDTEEVPLAGVPKKKKKLKKTKKKPRASSVTREPSSSMMVQPCRSSSDDYDSDEEYDRNYEIMALQQQQQSAASTTSTSRREQMMHHSKSEWSSEPDLNHKFNTLTEKLSNLQRLLSTSTNTSGHSEDEEIYDSEEFTVASAEEGPPPVPTSPSQLHRATSKGLLFHHSSSSSDDSSSSSSESEYSDHYNDDDDGTHSDSGSAASFAAGGGTSSEEEELMNSCEIKFFPSDDEVDPTADNNKNAGEKVEQQQQQKTMDSSDKRFPSQQQQQAKPAAAGARGRATQPRASPMTTHSAVSTQQLPPISPPFRKSKGVALAGGTGGGASSSRIASIDVAGNISTSTHNSNVDGIGSMLLLNEEEEVTMRRSNSREHVSRTGLNDMNEEEVTLRQSNSRERLFRTAAYAAIDEDDEEDIALWQPSSNSKNTKAWQSESALPSVQEHVHSKQNNVSNSANVHNVHPLVSPGRGIRKAFKNPRNSRGDLLRTPLMRQSSAPASTAASVSSNSSTSSPVVVRKPSATATASPVVARKKSFANTRKSVSASPRSHRKSSVRSNSKNRRRRSKSRDRAAVEKSLSRAGLHEAVEDVDEQQLLLYVTSGRVERTTLLPPSNSDSNHQEQLPPYVTPSRGERKLLSATQHDINKNKIPFRPSLKRSNSLSDTTTSRVNKEQQRPSSSSNAANNNVTKTPRTSSTISSESPYSPLQEMQGSLEQLKKSAPPPFPRNTAASAANAAAGSDNEEIWSDDDDIDLTLADSVGPKSNKSPAAGRRPSSGSKLLRNIQQESQEKRHQQHLENRDSLLDVLSLGGGEAAAGDH